MNPFKLSSTFRVIKVYPVTTTPEVPPTLGKMFFTLGKLARGLGMAGVAFITPALTGWLTAVSTYHNFKEMSAAQRRFRERFPDNHSLDLLAHKATSQTELTFDRRQLTAKLLASWLGIISGTALNLYLTHGDPYSLIYNQLIPAPLAKYAHSEPAYPLSASPAPAQP